MKLTFGAAGATILLLAACTASEGQQKDRTPVPIELPTPNVIMEAKPAPPFTYWAPEGSTIRNHSRNSGIWIAQSAGKPDKYYFGDQCQASRYQQFVGRPLAEMPEAPQGAIWRTHCSSCVVTDDLSFDRMNIGFDEKTNTVDAITCG